MDARYPLPSWPANTPPNRQLAIACAIAVTRNGDSRYIGGAASSVPGECIPLNEATLAAKIGAAVFGRTVDLSKPRARKKARPRHSIRRRRHRRDGPIKYPRARPIFEPSHRGSSAAHPTSHRGRSPDRNGQIGQIRPARQASEKAVGAPVLKLWNESRTNRARIADSVVVGIRSRPHLVGRPLRATKSCKRSKKAGALDAGMD